MDISERNFVSTLYVGILTFCILSDVRHVSRKFPREISEKKMLLYVFIYISFVVIK